jgi:hypothetical protein
VARLISALKMDVMRFSETSVHIQTALSQKMATVIIITVRTSDHSVFMLMGLGRCQWGSAVQNNRGCHNTLQFMFAVCLGIALCWNGKDCWCLGWTSCLWLESSVLFWCGALSRWFLWGVPSSHWLRPASPLLLGVYTKGCGHLWCYIVRGTCWICRLTSKKSEILML